MRRVSSSVSERGLSDTNGNRLIRVSCGQATNSFGSMPTTTTPLSVTKSIPSNSIHNTQRPELNNVEHWPALSSTHALLPALVVDDSAGSSNVLDKDYDQYDSQDQLAATSTLALTSTSNSVKAEPTNRNGFGFLSQDYLLIIAVVCGMAIVLVAVNVFCIWNYYKYVSFPSFFFHVYSIVFAVVILFNCLCVCVFLVKNFMVTFRLVILS